MSREAYLVCRTCKHSMFLGKRCVRSASDLIALIEPLGVISVEERARLMELFLIAHGGHNVSLLVKEEWAKSEYWIEEFDDRMGDPDYEAYLNRQALVRMDEMGDAPKAPPAS